MGGNNNTEKHDHSKVSDPAYEPANPLQVSKWMSQSARKYSTLAIPGVYGSEYDKLPFGLFPAYFLSSYIVPIS
jgi:hypothetical protein